MEPASAQNAPEGEYHAVSLKRAGVRCVAGSCAEDDAELPRPEWETETWTAARFLRLPARRALQPEVVARAAGMSGSSTAELRRDRCLAIAEAEGRRGVRDRQKAPPRPAQIDHPAVQEADVQAQLANDRRPHSARVIGGLQPHEMQ